jgi:hypothetical protein
MEEIPAKSEYQKIAVASGLITAGFMIEYFILMKSLNLVELLELRALNFFILSGGIILALNKYKKSNYSKVPYLEGFGLGLLTTGIAMVIFSTAMGVYLYVHPLFMEYIKKHVMMGSYLNPSCAALGILIEGSISGLIISFACMQYFKKFARGRPVYFKEGEYEEK